MFFFFPRRETGLEDQRARDEANRQEFDRIAEAVRLAYGYALEQPSKTLQEIPGLSQLIRQARTLDRRQRQVLRAYLYDATGFAHLESGQASQGLAQLEKAGRLYAGLPDKTPLVNNLLNQSRGWMMQNDMRRAFALLERSLEIARESRQAQVETDVLYKLGLLYSLDGQPEKAQETFRKGLLLAQQIGNRVSSAAYLAQFGQLYLQQGELDRAEDYYERSRSIFQEEDDKENLMVSYGQLDQLYRRKGDFDKALDYAGRGLALARELSNPREQVIFLQDLARIYIEQTGYERAADVARQSAGLAEELADNESRLRAYELLSQIELARNCLEAAQEWLVKGSELARRSGQPRDLALFLHDFADLRLAQGDPVAALGHYEEMAALFKDLKDLPTLSTLLVRMGEVYLEERQEPSGTARIARRAFDLIPAQPGSEALFAFTSTMRLIQLLAERHYYNEGLQVASECLEQANSRLRRAARRKRATAEPSRWVLFVQVLIILAATLQDLKNANPAYRSKVQEMLGQLKTRFGDSFTLDTWTGEMYERLS